MKANNCKQRYTGGFTLIEMVGVLAVIAILAALLVPKVITAISDAKYSNTVGAINTAKVAATSFYSKAGQFTNDLGFHQTLLANGFLDAQYLSKVGTTSTVEVVPAPGGVGNAGYMLDGATVGTSTTNTTSVVEAVIQGVAPSDAVEISRRLDGDAFTQTDVTAADTKGRVSYAAATNGTVTVYVYLMSK
jgi:prepilin-type N-terminal cleavage/methylation domain-containing protein